MDLLIVIKVIIREYYHGTCDVYSGEGFLDVGESLLPPGLRYDLIIAALYSKCTCHFQIHPSKIVTET